MIERAPAKATLSLRVLGRRANGYHDLEALTVSLRDPHDDVVVERRRDGDITLAVDGDEGVPRDAANLAWRAARLAGGGVDIRLVKRIPAEAGLGGGSADAAAVLRAMAESHDRATVLAAELGSDVPYCVRGGWAWMRGRGEVVDAMGDVGAEFAVLVAVPPFGLSTPAVYRAWDELGGPRATREIDPPASLRRHVDVLANDLEPAALAVEPRLAEWRTRVDEVAGHPALMAGSGTAHLVLFDAEPDDLVASLADALPDTRAWLTEPEAHGRPSST